VQEFVPSVLDNFGAPMGISIKESLQIGQTEFKSR